MRRFRRPVLILLFWGTATFLSLEKLIEWKTEGWWFDALGYSGVYVRMMDWRFGAFFLVGGAFAVLLTLQAKYAWGVAARSFAPLGLHSHDRPGRLIPLEDKLGLDRYRSSLTWWSILAISALAGLAAAARFDLWLRCYYASPSGQTDVLWHRDLTFYLFKIPAYEAAIAFANAALWISLGFSTLIYVYEEAFELGGHRVRIDPAAARHLSLLFALIVAWQGAGCWLRAGDAASVGTVSTGVGGSGYFGTIDALYRVPWLQVGEWVLPLAGACMIWLLWRRDLRRANWLGFGTWLALWFATSLVPAWMAATAPAEGALYPALNRKATRAAWDMDAGFTGATGPGSGGALIQARAGFATGNQVTGNTDAGAALQQLNLAPLWPSEAVRANLAQFLHARGSGLVPGTPSLEYWRIGTELRPVYVTVCQDTPQERSGAALDGLFVTDAAHTNEAGGPLVYASPLGADLPGPLVPAAAPVVRPNLAPLRLAYGTWPLAPGTMQDQTVPGLYDPYPSRPDAWASDADQEDAPLPADFDVLVDRGGSAATGVPLSGTVTRWLLGTRFSFSIELPDNLSEVAAGSAASSYIPFTGVARLNWHRRVTDRCRQLFPLLDWTHAGAHLVFDRQGSAFWLLDGYAWSHRYPDALAPFADDRANYGRAVALATVDGRTGAVKFYARDSAELFTRTYQAAFPDVLQPWSALPPDLKAQADVPAATFTAQSTVWMRLQTGPGGGGGAADGPGWRFALADTDADPTYASAADVIRSVWWTGVNDGAARTGEAEPALMTVFALPPGYSADESEHTSAPLGCGALVALPNGADGSVSLRTWTPPSPLALPPDLTNSPAVVILANGRTEYPPPSLLTILPVGSDFALADGVAEAPGEVQTAIPGRAGDKGPNRRGGDEPAVQLAGAFALVTRDGTLRADSLAELEQAVSSQPLASDTLQLRMRLAAAQDALAALRQAQAAGDLEAFGLAETRLQAALEGPDSPGPVNSPAENGNESRQNRVGWSAAPSSHPVPASAKDTKS